MNKKFGFVAALLLGLFLTSCHKANTPQELGKAYFQGYGCIKCHRIGNEGGKTGPDLTFVGFRKDREWLSQWLKDPHAWKSATLMPNFNLPDQPRADLVEYLSTLKGQSFETTGRPWNEASLLEHPIERGMVLFERAGCVACHAQKGRGGYPNNNVVGGQIPALTFVADGFSKEELKEKIRKGVTPEPEDPDGPKPLISMPVWGEVLNDGELDAVVEYLFSIRPPLSDEDDW